MEDFDYIDDGDPINDTDPLESSIPSTPSLPLTAYLKPSKPLKKGDFSKDVENQPTYQLRPIKAYGILKGLLRIELLPIDPTTIRRVRIICVLCE